MAEKEEIERLIRGARVKQKDLDDALAAGDFNQVVQEAYNIMYMAARACLNHLGANATSHRAVASIYRKELIGKHLLDRKYQDHLRKIHSYREETMDPSNPPMEREQAEKIVAATKDFVIQMSNLIAKYPEPVINYDISDFA